MEASIVVTSLWDLPPRDVRPALAEERRRLVDLLADLSDDDWQASTAVPGWRVKDLALHLLDDDLGWLSRGRDSDRSGLILDTGASLARMLAEKNQRWIDGAQGLSRRVVTDLLRWTGQQMDGYYEQMDLNGDGFVGWAADGPVPVWFDMAQDLTERWVHQQQIREALSRDEGFSALFLPEVLRTFVWAVPHQYAADAEAGTRVGITLGAGGDWNLVCVGEGRWVMSEGPGERLSAALHLAEDAAWRSFTGASVAPAGVSIEGDHALAEPLLYVRAIIV